MVEKITPEIATAELGSTGLKRFGGLVYEEFLRELSGTRAVKVYKEMSSNDPVVGAIIFAIEMLIRQVSWRTEAASNEQDDLAAADFVDSCMGDMSQSWTDTIAEVMSMLPYGWSWHETVYKMRLGPSEDGTKNSRFNDGKISWRKMPIRSQDSLYQWGFDETGGIQSMTQQAPPDYRLRTIPIEKSLLFRTTAHKGNPEGRSILRNAYRPWYMKKHIENIEAIGIERDLTGLPIFWIPANMLVSASQQTPEARAAVAEYKKMISNIKRDEQEGIIMPLVYDENGNKQYDVTLLTTGGRRQFETTDIINRYNQQIAMTVLADFILLGHEKVGSFALSSSKTSMFSTALGAWLDSIQEIFNRFAIPRLFELNGARLDKLPKIVHGDIETIDLAELGSFITSLAGAGAQLFPDPELENHLKRQAGLPVNEDQTHEQTSNLGDENIDLPPETPGNGIDPTKVTGVTDLIKSVVKGEIPRSSAVKLLVAGFGMSAEFAENLLSDAGVTPKP